MSVKPTSCPCPCHKPGASVARSGHLVEELPGAYICSPCPECWTPDIPSPKNKRANKEELW